MILTLFAIAILFLLVIVATERRDGRTRFVIVDGRTRRRSSVERDSRYGG